MSTGSGRSGLDPSALDRLLRIGGQDFVVEMIELFLENAPDRLATARVAFEGGDFATLYRAAHSLKSTAGNLGARDLQATAETLEARAAARETEGLSALMEELDARYGEVQGVLEMERDRRKGGAT